MTNKSILELVDPDHDIVSTSFGLSYASKKDGKSCMKFYTPQQIVDIKDDYYTLLAPKSRNGFKIIGKCLAYPVFLGKPENYSTVIVQETKNEVSENFFKRLNKNPLLQLMTNKWFPYYLAEPPRKTSNGRKIKGLRKELGVAFESQTDAVLFATTL